MSKALAADSHISHYRIVSRIGAGGMGEVYLAEDTTLDRKVAIKILPMEATPDERANKRLIREAKAAAKLDHPNICSVYEVSETDGVSFIVMQYVEGETLASKFQQNAIELKESLIIGAQIADALVEAHSRGIVHRDIKPQNIMISARGQVKVMDFGLAKMAVPKSLAESVAETQSLLTEPGLVIGTVPYMSPEQVKAQEVDARSDIFSFGAVLYEMVSGRQPFGAESAAETLSAILTREPLPVSRYSPHTPAELERIVSKALEKNREERYQSAKEMLLDMKRLTRQLEFDAEQARAGRASRNSSDTERRAGGIDVRTSPPASITQEEAVVDTTFNTSSTASAIKPHKLGLALALAALIVAMGIGYWVLFHRFSNVTTIDSIAVMPLENVTHDDRLEYLSDGITESLINSLSQLPHIKVIARSSVFSYKNQILNLPQIARQLNVKAVLTGRVVMQDDRLDFRVELTDVQNNTQLWGDHYIRRVADILAVQDEIARQVTDTLRVRLTTGQQQQVNKRYTENAEAYRMYLQGRFFQNQGGSQEDLSRAIGFYDQAIALDRDYALAYAARGQCFFDMGDVILSMSDAKAKVERDITAALAIDPNLVEARTALANLEFQYNWNFGRAEEDFKRVIELNPNYAEAHHQYGGYYLPMTGRPMEGLAEMKLAHQLDPVNPSINVDMALPYFLARQYDEGIAQVNKSVEKFPNFFLPHMVLGQALCEKGEIPEGIQELERAKSMEPTPLVISTLGYYCAKGKRKDEARKLLGELIEQSKTHYVPSYWIAVIYVGLGEKDEALKLLEKAYQERSFFLLFIKTEPKLDDLRSDPRFTDLVRRIGFPQ
jgi:serine/threonine protein kinase/Flp pilus assembly protein TadD